VRVPRYKSSLIITALEAVLYVTSVPAREAESPLDALFACQKISDSAARLTCLDREVAALRSQTKSEAVIAVDRKKLEQDNYGLNRSNMPLPAPKSENPAAGGPAASSAERQIVRDKAGRIEGMENLAVAGIDHTPYGQVIVKLKNGQVWKQTDRVELFIQRHTPVEGMTVSISNAALGSHKMQINSDGPWFRVVRAN
jgi:hypothetical protein